MTAIALPAIATPAFAALPTPVGGSGPDAMLLWQVALADRYWHAYVQADATFDRLYHAMECHPAYPGPWPDTPTDRAAYEAVADLFGIQAAEDRSGRLYELHEAAASAAFATSARTLPGAVTKMRLAVAAANERCCGGWDHEECEALELALADLDRLVAA